jgi:undecaprenyl diphosphate synthase
MTVHFFPTCNNTSKANSQIFQGIKHIAFIPDGHARWARLNQKTLEEAHRISYCGIFPNVAQTLFESGVDTVTLWWFKEINVVKRPEDEVLKIFEICQQAFTVFKELAHRHQVKIIHAGSMKPPQGISNAVLRSFSKVMESLHDLVQETRHYHSHRLVFAINYDGEHEMLRLCQQLNGANSSFLTRGSFKKFTDLGRLPYPEIDLLMRPGVKGVPGGITGGIFPLQTSHTFYYFTENYTPDWTLLDMINAANALKHPDATYKSNVARQQLASKL